MTTLVAGSTGTVGGLVAEWLAAHGPVRALVRPTSDPGRRAALAAAGAELVTGDLKDRESLDRACHGVRTVVTTVSTTLSSQPGDSIDTVDRRGQLDLVDAAEAAGVEHIVLLSFCEQPVESPLQDAKRAVEDRLTTGRAAWTVLRPTMFAESWLGPALGFDHGQRRVRLLGDGTVPHHYITVPDVAGYVAGAVGNSRAHNRVFDLGGLRALSARDAVGIFERVTGARFEVESVPADELRAGYEAAVDPMAKSFAALMLAATIDAKLDPEPVLDVIRLPHRETVAEYAARVTA